jgi:hypothetical protein
MSNQEILDAIDKAKDGIAKYILIMESLYAVNVSSDAAFQRLYNAFYRVQRRPRNWYQAYFQLMEELKKTRPSFPRVLTELNARLGKYEPSFSSKLVATIDPWKPVWDEFVLKNTEHTPPAYTSPTKHDEAVVCYNSIQTWYMRFMATDEAKNWIRLFNGNVPSYYKITDVKR